MRLAEARVAWGWRVHPQGGQCGGATRAPLVQIARYTPCSRHQRSAASFIAAVVITAQPGARSPTPPSAGLDCASSRQRSRVPAPTPPNFPRYHLQRSALAAATSYRSVLECLSVSSHVILHRRPGFLVLLRRTILTRGPSMEG